MTSYLALVSCCIHMHNNCGTNFLNQKSLYFISDGKSTHSLMTFPGARCFLAKYIYLSLVMCAPCDVSHGAHITRVRQFFLRNVREQVPRMMNDTSTVIIIYVKFNGCVVVEAWQVWWLKLLASSFVEFLVPSPSMNKQIFLVLWHICWNATVLWAGLWWNQ